MGAKFEIGVAGITQDTLLKQSKKLLRETSNLIELLIGPLSSGLILNIEVNKSIQFDWPAAFPAESLNENDLFALYSEDRESSVLMSHWSNYWEFSIAIPIDSPRLKHAVAGELLTSLWSATQTEKAVVAFSGEELSLGDTLDQVIDGIVSPTTLKTCDEFIISATLAKEFGIEGLSVNSGIHYRYSLTDQTL